MSDRLFDPRLEAVLATGSLFERDDLEQLFQISDQASEEDRAAMRAM